MMIFGDTAQTYWQRVALMKSLGAAQALLPSAWYEMLEEYYFNNGLYDMVSLQLHENAIWAPGMKPLRNPAHRAVEFHVSHLWPGSLARAFPLVTENASLPDAIARIDAWSNWGSQKQLAARWFANFGDMFIKIAEKSENNEVTRVYKDPIKPKYVTDFDLDERGFITYIRIDVPAGDETHTEVWSKTRGGYRLWIHNRSIDTPLEQLGTPTDTKTFEDLGFDFIPIVHAKFKDIGETRGVGCFVHALDKIDEANRQATRLHQILFRYNKPTTAVSANGTDASGKPLPPPVLTGRDGSTASTDNPVTQGDDDIWTLPGTATIEQIVPDIQYDAALAILNAQMNELSNDLPEILWYELKDKGELSNVALKTLLGPAISRVLEARGNAEPALVRANQMALTIAGIHGLDGFRDLGSFENGDLEHNFAERDVIPVSAREKADMVKADVDAGLPLLFSLKHHGYSEEEIEEVKASEEYKLRTAGLFFEVAGKVNSSGIPMETFLRAFGWTDEQLQDMGTQRLAAIKLKQEDSVPAVRQ